MPGQGRTSGRYHGPLPPALFEEVKRRFVGLAAAKDIRRPREGVLGAVTLVIGPLQFLVGFRARFPRSHRYLGRTYAVAVVIGSIAGLVAARMSTSGIPAQIGFVLLALAWLFTMWKGYRAARARCFADHRIWMIRNYALTFAAVLLRVFLGLGGIAMAIWPQVTFNDIYLASIWV